MTSIIKLLRSNAEIQSVIRNTGWLFLDYCLRIGLGLVINIWIARYLGATQFGIWNFTSAIVAIIGSFSNLGLSSIVVQDLVRNPKSKAKILGSTFFMQLISSSILLVFSIPIAFLVFHKDLQTLGLIIALSFVNFFGSFDAINLWFQSQINSKYTVFSRMTAFSVYSLLTISAILLRLPLVAMGVTKNVEAFVNSIGLIVGYKLNKQNLILWKWDTEIAVSLIRRSWPIALSSFAVALYVKADLVMLGKMLGPKEVGIYSIATRLSEIWYFIPSIVLPSLLPSLVAAREKSIFLYTQRLRKVYFFMSLTAIIISIGISLYSEFLVVLLFGDPYRESSTILSIHVWSILFVFLGGASSNWLIIEDLSRYSAYRTLIGGGFNIVLNIFLIPRYGGLGAAVATLVSYAMATFSLVMFPRTRPCVCEMMFSLNPHHVFSISRTQK